MFDTLGLGLFSTIVASIALQAGCDFYICLLLGVATALFGGVLRDILCNEIPKVFHRNKLYARCAFVVSLVFLASLQMGLNALAAMLAGVLATEPLKFLSVKCNIRLPF